MSRSLTPHLPPKPRHIGSISEGQEDSDESEDSEDSEDPDDNPVLFFLKKSRKKPRKLLK
jgi:hypothetical protein